MEITIQAVEKVMEETGLEYRDAKALLEQAGGDPEKAVALFSGGDSAEGREKVDDIMDRLKARVKEGNVDRVQIRKGEQIVLSVPVNVGIIGGLIGAVAAPWALIAGAIAAFGFGCRIEVVKKDGTTDEIG